MTLKDVLSKSFLGCALVVSGAWHVKATTIVAARTADEIVIGADSKVTDTFGDAYTTRACKIVQAGNLFFAYAGLARDNKTGFDAPRIAGEALRLAPAAANADASVRVGLLTGLVATRLFDELKFLKRNHPEVYREKIEGKAFLKILVAGFERGKPLLFVRQFRAAPLGREGIGVSVFQDDCLADCAGAGAAGGVVTRFLGETDAIDGLPEETPDFWKDGLADGVRRLIETEIAARAEYVGPPVDILRIDKRGGASWVEKKSECAEVRGQTGIKSSSPKRTPKTRRARKP